MNGFLLLSDFYFRLPRTMTLLLAAFRAYLPAFHVLFDHPGALMVWCLNRCDYLIDCKNFYCVFVTASCYSAVEIVGFSFQF